MCLPADGNVRMREDKSFAYDLDVQRGIVSSRVALLLRSAEIKPLLSDLLLRQRKFVPQVWEGVSHEQENEQDVVLRVIFYWAWEYLKFIGRGSI